jgi:soluble cytochrome b562
MRKELLLSGMLALLAAAAGAGSADTELDTDLMQTIEDTNKSLSSNISVKDARAAASDAKELTEMFAKVEDHFTRKGGAGDAVDLAKKSRRLSSDIATFVAAGNFESATDSATTLSRTCRTCHTFYKKE